MLLSIEVTVERWLSIMHWCYLCCVHLESNAGPGVNLEQDNVAVH